MKRSFFIFGIGLVVLGLFIFSDPKLKRPFTARYIDLTGFNIFYGPALIVAGIVFVWLSFRKKQFNRSASLLICPRCENVYETGRKRIPQCTRCRIDLEMLTGFYDRHPEMKEDRTITKAQRDIDPEKDSDR